MAALTWDEIGERFYETGLDHGVLYIPNNVGVYATGVSWNGLYTVTESPSGAEPTALYADNIKYLNLFSAEEFMALLRRTPTRMSLHSLMVLPPRNRVWLSVSKHERALDCVIVPELVTILKAMIMVTSCISFTDVRLVLPKRRITPLMTPLKPLPSAGRLLPHLHRSPAFVLRL